MSAKKARRIRESEDAMRRDFARDGGRSELVIAVDDVEKKKEMAMFADRAVLILPVRGHVQTRQHFSLANLPRSHEGESHVTDHN